MNRTFFVSSCVALTLTACSGGRDGRVSSTPVVDAPVTTDWRGVATNADRDRLRRWRGAWTTALATAKARDAAAIRKEGSLFDPDHALSNPLPPPGRYHCRVFKLGAANAGGLPFVAYPNFDCRVAAEGELTSLYKETGSQRPRGLLFPDSVSRAIFLGTLVLGDEQRALDYGQDSERDMAGIMERVGERRWRLSLPWPRFESQLDVVELVPAR